MIFHSAAVAIAVILLCTIEDTQASDRGCISRKALRYVGSTEWAKDASRPPLDAGDWKCNLFVAEVVEACGFTVPHRRWWYSPIGANEWANPESTYLENSCWTLCSNRHTQVGDVLAVGGHVGIVTESNSQTTSAARYSVVQNDWGFRSGQDPTCWRYNC